MATHTVSTHIESPRTDFKVSMHTHTSMSSLAWPARATEERSRCSEPNQAAPILTILAISAFLLTLSPFSQEPR